MLHAPAQSIADHTQSITVVNPAHKIFVMSRRHTIIKNILSSFNGLPVMSQIDTFYNKAV